MTTEGSNVSVKIAVAPDSWGVWYPEDPQQVPWSRFLDEAAASGFDAVELGPYGYLPTNIDRLRAELSARGLTLTGAFYMSEFQAAGNWSASKDQVAEICELLNDFGAAHLVLLNSLYTDMATGERIGPTELDHDSWSRLLETLHAIAAYTAGHGIATVYHPHGDTVIQYEDQIEILLQNTDASTVSLCLDVGHHAYAGGDAVRFMQRHHDRIPYMHLKNVDPEVISSVRNDDVGFVKAVGMGAFTTLDAGSIDMHALRQVLDGVGYDGWAVVEQDMYPCPFDQPLPIARRNRAFLRAISFG
jgi:inosose dehydratase